jgi:hypothetical protein
VSLVGVSLVVPNWYVRYGHAPHWHASHKRVYHGRRRDHGVGRESSSHVCNTNCVSAQVHLAILSLALFVLMIRHTFFLSRGSRHLTMTHRQNNLHSPLAHAHQPSAFGYPQVLHRGFESCPDPNVVAGLAESPRRRHIEEGKRRLVFKSEFHIQLRVASFFRTE